MLRRADELQPGDVLSDGRTVVSAEPGKGGFVLLGIDDAPVIPYAPDYTTGLLERSWQDEVIAELVADPTISAKVVEVVDRKKPVKDDGAIEAIEVKR